MESTRDVIIQVERFEEAVAFYRDVLGFRSIAVRDDLIGFETGSFMLYVEPGAAPGPVFELECDDVSAAKQLLLAHGCSVVDENSAVPRCYVRDPYGLTLNLNER
jgi:catechol 2,3-dioxygenase-like lactoylglutathione lyase family enzyme